MVIRVGYSRAVVVNFNMQVLLPDVHPVAVSFSIPDLELYMKGSPWLHNYTYESYN